MDNPLGDVSKMMQAGAWLIAKVAGIYILLPVVVALIIFLGILKIKGTMFQFLMLGVLILCAYLFTHFGMHQLIIGADKISKTS